MRLAFVIRLGKDTSPKDGKFEGWVEEVDSCVQRRFRSADELLHFLGERFELVSAENSDPLAAIRALAEDKSVRGKKKTS